VCVCESRVAKCSEVRSPVLGRWSVVRFIIYPPMGPIYRYNRRAKRLQLYCRIRRDRTVDTTSGIVVRGGSAVDKNNTARLDRRVTNLAVGPEPVALAALLSSSWFCHRTACDYVVGT